MANLIDKINTKIANTTNQMYGGSTPVPVATQTPKVVEPIKSTTTIPNSVKAPINSTTVIPSLVKAPEITGQKLVNPTPIVLPPKTVDNSPTKVNEVVGSFANQQALSYEDELKNIKDKYGDTNQVTDLMRQISGVEATQQDEANKLQAQENLQAYKKYTTDIDLENERTRQAIEKIQRENPTGALRGGQQDLIANIERDSGNRLAILTIQRSAALGDYNTAIETAKAKVDMQLAPLKAELERLKYVQENNKDFQTAEINMLAKKKENEIKKEEDRLLKGEEMLISALQFGAPSSIISEARNILDNGGSMVNVAQKLGKYHRDLDMEIKKSQIAKNWADAQKNDIQTGVLTEKQLKQIDTSPQGKKLVSLSGLFQKSKTYKNLVDTYGFQAVGKEKTLLDNAYADLKIAYKEAANLGALTGPDVSLIEEAIKPSSGALNYLNYKVSGGQGGISGGIDQALSKAKKEALQNYKQLTARDANYRNSDYVNQLIVPFAEDYSNVDLDNVSAGEIIQTEDGVLLESLGDGNFSPL